MSRLNRWLAVRITRAVGTMWCAYAFTALALLGLPAAIRTGTLVAWFAQTFLQLVLLSILAVGQQVAAEQAAEHRDDIQAVHDRLDAHGDHLAAIHAHTATVAARLHDTTPQPRTGRNRKEPAP